MIYLTKLNGEPFGLNDDLIETISENPDTTIKLFNDKLYIVRETMDEVVDKIKNYKRFVFEKSIFVDKDRFLEIINEDESAF